MCHQVAEKGLKGLYVIAAHATPPYIHALVKLARLSNTYNELSREDQTLLDLLEPLNIEARYPAQKDAVLQSLTVERCRELIQGTERLLLWIKEKCDDELQSTPE
jgi:HEPN domain-containing protein